MLLHARFPAQHWETQMLPEVLCRLVNNCQTVHSLYSQLNYRKLAAIEWAQRDLRFCFQHPRTPSSVLPHLFISCYGHKQQQQRPTVLLTLHLVFTYRRKKKTLNTMPAEPGALNQTHEDTNLHLLSVWRGFPKMKQKGRGFPKTETWEFAARSLVCVNRNFIFKREWTLTIRFLGNPSSNLKSFSAHYATSLCFLYWLLLLLLLSPLVCLCREESTSTVSRQRETQPCLLSCQWQCILLLLLLLWCQHVHRVAASRVFRER